MSLRHSRASLLVQKFNSSKQLSFFYRHQVERVRVHCIEINIERHELVVRKARLKGWQRLEVGLVRRREGVGATFADERFVFYERNNLWRVCGNWGISSTDSLDWNGRPPKINHSASEKSKIKLPPLGFLVSHSFLWLQPPKWQSSL